MRWERERERERKRLRETAIVTMTRDWERDFWYEYYRNLGQFWDPQSFLYRFYKTEGEEGTNFIQINGYVGEKKKKKYIYIYIYIEGW